jgi:hypothetical protein
MSNKNVIIENCATDYMLYLLFISNQIKVYHWRTSSYARHKASDELYSEFNNLVDRFIETLHGRIIIDNANKDFRIAVPKKKIELYDFNDNNIKDLLLLSKKFLEEDLHEISKYSELANIRDEMLALINKNIYLFTLK